MRALVLTLLLMACNKKDDGRVIATKVEAAVGVAVASCTQGDLLELERMKCGLEAGTLKLVLSAPPSAEVVVDGKPYDVPASGRVDVAVDFGARFFDKTFEDANPRDVTSTSFSIAWSSPAAGSGTLVANGRPSEVFAGWLRSVVAAKPAGFAPAEPRFAALIDENGVSTLERTRKVRELALVGVLDPSGEPKAVRTCAFITHDTREQRSVELRGAPAKLTITDLATGSVDTRDLPAPTECPPLSMSTYAYVLGVRDYPALLRSMAR